VPFFDKKWGFSQEKPQNFGEHKRNQSELLKMTHWRYCYCGGVI